MMEVVVSISKLEALAAVDDDPDVGECLENVGVVARRVEGEVVAEEALHVRRAEQLPLHDHLHHGRPEVGVGVPRPLTPWAPHC